MEKLIELLNKFEAKLEEMPLSRERWREENGILYRRFMSVEDAERMVISKSFGFIKWLIENDKINIDKIPEIGEIYSDCNELIRYCYIVLEDDIYPKDCSLLMLLAISENPIEDLISYLK